MNNLTFPENRDLDFIAMGRLAIDLNSNQTGHLEDTVSFSKYLGGSPANITVALARLGVRAGFMGRVADDQFGRFITQYLKKNGINMDGIVVDRSGAKTGLTFTEIISPYESSILMYRDEAVDLKLSIEDINEDYIKRTNALVVSGTALSSSPSREAVFAAIELAVKHDVTIFFDIDYRPYTWHSDKETAIYYSLAAEKCDVIIGTREEFDMLEMLSNPGNKDDYVTARKWFDYKARIVVIKHGKEGSFAYTKEGERIEGAVFPVVPVKTFGAGDSYAGGFLFGLLQGKDVAEAMKIGAASASIVVSSHSCSEAMPTLDKIHKFIAIYDGEKQYDVDNL